MIFNYNNKLKYEISNWFRIKILYLYKIWNK